MSKRATGEGTIFQRKGDGRWAGSIHMGYLGAQRQRRTFYGATEAEVLAKMKSAHATIGAGLPIPPTRLTVGAVLDQWLVEAVKPTVRASTYRRHSDIVRCHLQPTLGHVRLASLTPAQVQRLLNSKLAAGLAPRTVQYIRGVLRHALGRAMRWGYIGINVAALTDPPRIQPHEVAAISPEDARALLKAVAEHQLASLFITALATGMRQGELLGARWQDVDLDSGTLRVAGNLQRVDGQYVLLEPKTAKSKRPVALPTIAVDALRTRGTQQKAQRLRAGSLWTNPLDLIFTTPFGKPMHGPTVTRSFQTALEVAQLPRQRFHDLRHGAASLLLAQGVPMKVVQEALGHATISVTADVYGHLLPELQKDAAIRMDQALRGAV